MMTFKWKQILGRAPCTRSMAAEVFGDKELLHAYFRNCFTVKNFGFNRAARSNAAAGHLEIKPVAVRGNVNLDAYRQYMAGSLAGKLRVCHMDWPTHLDPTAKVPPDALLDNGEKPDVVLMTEMLSTNAPYMRHLFLHMSLAVDILYLYPGIDAVACDDFLWPYEHINRFLDALTYCAGLETLIIEQKDFVAHNARRHSVQVKVLEIIKEMKHLWYLHWNGNMIEDRFLNVVQDNVVRRMTICDYLPPSLMELVIEDGGMPRFAPWNRHSLSPAVGLLMSQRVVGNLHTLTLPCSFWSLPLEYFKFFIEMLNAGTRIQNIGIIDDFKLNKGPVERVRGRHAYRAVQHPPPRLELLVTSVRRDMTIELGPCEDAVERAERLAWAASLSTNATFFDAERDDGVDVTTFTFSRMIVHDLLESTHTALIKVLV